MSNLKPFTFSPSERWDGNNGNWSSFFVRIGTPEQDFRVLPSAAIGAVFVPGLTGCSSSIGDPHNCADSRGVHNFTYQLGFEPNASKTWLPEGDYGAGIATELGYAANASYGRDTVGLISPNSGAPKLVDQVIGSLYLSQPFFVGFFGLSPKAINFSDFESPRPSYITSLRTDGQIPSISYGYTAGAIYRQMLGSLTLGGYDENRFEPNNITFPFGPNDERPTSLVLQHISADSAQNGSVSFLQRQIFVNIDFTMAYLWLPPDTCERIASHFKLNYDFGKNLYLINESSHAELVSSDPSFTFDFGGSRNPAERVSIVISYAAFDLQASWPIYNSTTRYFPIRQTNTSHYTIGRAFMQEAYMIVDYERKNFSLHQALFPAMREQKLTAIVAQDADQNAKIDNNGTHLSIASTAGIAIGSTISLLLLITGVVLCYRRKQRSEVISQPDVIGYGNGKDVEGRHELAGNMSVKQLMSTEIIELEVPQSELT